MNTIELMDASVSSYSRTDHAIYETIRKFPDVFATLSVTQLSETTGYSKPALTRFAQRLGFGGFVEFQHQFSQDLRDMRTRTDKPTHAETYGELLKAVEERVDRATVEALLARMRGGHCTYLMGYNLSRFPAEELCIALQFERQAHVVFPQVDMLPAFRGDDLVMVYSAVSGGSFKGLFDSIRMGRVERPHLVLVTTNAKHPLRRRFDEVIVLPTAAIQDGSRAVLADTFAFLMFNDVVASVAAELGQGQSSEQDETN